MSTTLVSLSTEVELVPMLRIKASPEMLSIGVTAASCFQCPPSCRLPKQRSDSDRTITFRLCVVLSEVFDCFSDEPPALFVNG